MMRLKLMAFKDGVAIVTDNSSSYPKDLAAKRGIFLAPVFVTFSDGQSIEDDKIDPEKFYARLKKEKKLPQTSGTNPGHFKEVFLRLAKNHQEILCLTAVGKLSCIFSSAVLAAREVQKEMPSLKIKVIDSQNLSVGLFLLVEAAVEAKKNGKSLEEIVALVSSLIPKIKVLIALNTLENIVKGGRLPKVAGWVSSIFQIKPILEMKEGELKPLTRALTFPLALNKLSEIIKGDQHKNGEFKAFAIAHTNRPDLGERFSAMIKKEGIFTKDIPILEAGVALGVHAAEGAVIAAYY